MFEAGTFLKVAFAVNVGLVPINIETTSPYQPAFYRSQGSCHGLSIRKNSNKLQNICLLRDYINKALNYCSLEPGSKIKDKNILLLMGGISTVNKFHFENKKVHK